MKRRTVGFSFGYMVVRAFKRADGGRTITALDVFEISITMMPMNNATTGDRHEGAHRTRRPCAGARLEARSAPRRTGARTAQARGGRQVPPAGPDRDLRCLNGPERAQYHLPRAKPPKAMSPTKAMISPIQRLQTNITTIPTMTMMPPVEMPAIPRRSSDPATHSSSGSAPLPHSYLYPSHSWRNRRHRCSDSPTGSRASPSSKASKRTICRPRNVKSIENGTSTAIPLKPPLARHTAETKLCLRLA
jgi:Caudovirus prohead serine protease